MREMFTPERRYAPPPPQPEKPKEAWEKGKRERLRVPKLEKEEREREVEKLDIEFEKLLLGYFSASRLWRENPRKEREEKALLGAKLAKNFIKRNILYAIRAGREFEFPGTNIEELRAIVEQGMAREHASESSETLLLGWENELHSAFLFWALESKERAYMRKRCMEKGMTDEETKQYIRENGIRTYYANPEEDAFGGIDFWVDCGKSVAPELAHLKGRVLGVSAKYKNRRDIRERIEDPIFPARTNEDITFLKNLDGGKGEIYHTFEKDIEKVRRTSERYKDAIPCIMVIHEEMRRELKTALGEEGVEITPVPRELVEDLENAVSRETFV